MPPVSRPPADATRRFSDRVEDYVRARPDYPAAVIDLLRGRAGLGPQSRVADLGAGTGIFTRQLLAASARVWAVEPNAAMRKALRAATPNQPNLRIVDATAEDTGLPEHSFDLITAAQAFHWFDRAKVRLEMARLLRARGWLALIWNSRRETGSRFLSGYEALLRRHANEYAAVNHRRIDAQAIGAFCAPAPIERHVFAHAQRLDFEGFRRRLLSSSYAPPPGHPNHAPMLAELRELFDLGQQGGCVTIEYDTEVYLSQLGG